MRAGRQDVDLYGSLVEKLSQYGEVLTPFVADKKITELGSEHEGGDKGIQYPRRRREVVTTVQRSGGGAGDGAGAREPQEQQLSEFLKCPNCKGIWRRVERPNERCPVCTD